MNIFIVWNFIIKNTYFKSMIFADLLMLTFFSKFKLHGEKKSNYKSADKKLELVVRFEEEAGLSFQYAQRFKNSQK